MKLLPWLLIAAAAPFLTQCAKPAPKPAPRPEWAFNVSIQMTPEALANLNGEKKVRLKIYYYGQPVPGSQQKTDRLGRLILGEDEFSMNYDNPNIHLTGGGIDQALLDEVVNREINIQIMVNSMKPHSPDEPPFVECRSYRGPIATAHIEAPVITCDKYRP